MNTQQRSKALLKQGWRGLILLGLLSCSTVRVNFTHIPKVDRVVANVPLGKRLNIIVNADGRMALGVIYTTADDPEGNSWIVNYTARIDDNDFRELPDEVYWNIYLRGADKYLYDWSKDRALMRAQIKDPQLRLKRQNGVAEIQELLSHQKEIILVYADAEFEPLYAVDLGAMCAESPQYFKNLTNSGKSCGEIGEAEVKDRRYPNTPQD